MVIFTIIGALIGAGFASGQEIYIFFYQYGIKGIYGLIVCSILIGIVIYKTLMLILKNKIEKYEEFLNIIFNNRKAMSKITNNIVNIFLLISFFIMIAGFGAYLEQEFYIKKIIGAIILAIICFFIFMTSMKGVAKISEIIVPVLIISILIIGTLNITKIENNQIQLILFNRINWNFNWLLQSIIYCSYNIILLTPVLINLGKYLKDKKQILIISILCALIVFILAINIFLLLVNIKTDISLIEMPAVYAISEKFNNLKVVYGFVILISIFSTAISIGISLLENITKNRLYFTQIALIMCISSVIISNFGFSNLVKILFPLFGYLGLMQIFCTIKVKN